MNRIWLMSTAILCSLVPGLFGRVVAADDDATGARLLPKNTLIYFSAPSIPDSRKSFESSAMGGLFRDPDMQPFLADVKTQIATWSETVEEHLGVTIDDLLSIPQGELTFALVERPARKLAPVLIVDYDKDKETINRLLKKLHESLDGDTAEHSTETIEEVPVQVFKFKDQPKDNPFQTLAYFDDDSCLVFSTEVAALTAVLQRWEGDSTDTLADNDVYKAILDKCQEGSTEPEIVWFINPIGLIQAGLGMAQAKVPQAGLAGLFLPTLGLDRLKGWGGVAYAKTEKFEELYKSFVYADQPKGVLDVFQFPASELAPPAWVSAQTGSYFSANWNLAQAYQAIETMVDGVYGRGFTAKQLDAVAEDGPEIHPKRDLIDLLEGRFHVLQGSEKSDDEDDSTEQFLLAVHVKDVAQFKKTLSKAVAAGEGQVEQREFNGETIYEVSAGPDQLISAAVASGCLVVTNNAAWLERMMRSGSEPTLADSPEYKKVSRHFPAKVSMLSYASPDSQFKSIYESLRSQENFDFLDGIDLTKLPPFETVKKYLRPSGSYVVPDAKGALYVEFLIDE